MDLIEFESACSISNYAKFNDIGDENDYNNLLMDQNETMNDNFYSGEINTQGESNISEKNSDIKTLITKNTNHNFLRDINHNEVISKITIKNIKNCFQGPNQSTKNESIQEKEIEKEKNINIISEKNKNENIIIDEEREQIKKNKKIFMIQKIDKLKNSSANYKIKKIKIGRRKKTDTITRKHNKTCEDNIIIKIKVHFFQYIRDITKKNSIYGKIDFKKINHSFIHNLNKEKNIKLFNMKIKEILSEQKITSKNKNSKSNENEKIINKIFSEKKDIKLIKILELTFHELFIIFRHSLELEEDQKEILDISRKIEGLDLLYEKKYQDINYLIEKTQQKNEDGNYLENKQYIQKIISMCGFYEEWFKRKIGRKQKK